MTESKLRTATAALVAVFLVANFIAFIATYTLDEIPRPLTIAVLIFFSGLLLAIVGTTVLTATREQGWSSWITAAMAVVGTIAIVTEVYYGRTSPNSAADIGGGAVLLGGFMLVLATGPLAKSWRDAD